MHIKNYNGPFEGMREEQRCLEPRFSNSGARPLKGARCNGRGGIHIQFLYIIILMYSESGARIYFLSMGGGFEILQDTF